MSLALIHGEIRRFLSTDTPEVLCIKGKWGVGKTYGWKSFLSESNRDKSLKFTRYAYVSLFGINSLEDLRFSIFENTVSGKNIGKGADDATFSDLVNTPDVARKFRPFIEAASSFFNRKGITDVLFKSAFLTVRKQLVCLDDIERAGKGLTARDVLGLASFLKEDRQCKIVLLLNDEEHDEKDEFERHLEKVVDVTLKFDLTAAEAVSIALRSDERVSSLLKPRVVELGITNIRVIKKIERLACRLVDLLAGYHNITVESAIATLALASWAVQQPTLAPSIDFIRGYNRLYERISADREQPDVDVARYRSILSVYPFRGVDKLDNVIIDGAISGYFIENLLREAADEIENDRRYTSRDTEFSRAWDDLYHGSLAVDDDKFLDALYESSVAEAKYISPININSAIRLLREGNRDDQANSVISRYIDVRDAIGPEFFKISNHHFSAGDQIDDGLRDAFAARRSSYVDSRDPFEVLRSMGERQSWSDADIQLMAKQSVEDFERMFEQLRGRDLSRSIELILLLGRSTNEGHDAIHAASVEALRSIAAKSPLRARKIARFGVELDADAPVDGAA